MGEESPNIRPVACAGEESRCEPWPRMPDGTKWDGKDLLSLVRDGRSPFGNVWDVKLLLREVEDHAHGTVIDIPKVHNGANHYGFQVKLSDQREVLARLSRIDMNMPNYDGFAETWLHNLVEFEAAVYQLLEGTVGIPTSRLLYFRHAHQSQGPKTELPKDISGRRLMIFEMSKDNKPHWRVLSKHQKVVVITSLDGESSSLLAQAAKSRAALLNKELPPMFVSNWIFWTSFQPVEWMPKMFPLPPAATRDFCISMLKAKVEGLIGDVGDSIGWAMDKQTVGPRAFAAKQSLLRLIPLILPPAGDNDDVLYRFVLQHDDFGIHNMSVYVDEKTGDLRLNSVYDWETGCIVPLILSEIEFLIYGRDFKLLVDGKGEPSVYTPPDVELELERRVQDQQHAVEFANAIYEHAPYMKETLRVGRDARKLWYTLKQWQGDDPEEFFGELGLWAAARRSDLVANTLPSAATSPISEDDLIKHPGSI